jgi:hypothetical protein
MKRKTRPAKLSLDEELSDHSSDDEDSVPYSNGIDPIIYLTYLSFYPFVFGLKQLCRLPELLEKGGGGGGGGEDEEDEEDEEERDGPEFGLYHSFHPRLVEECVCLGYFPMSIVIDSQSSLFSMAFKLHHRRCLLSLSAFSPRKSVRRIARRFHFSTNCAFDDVVRLIVKQHGHNWLCPPLIRSFRHMHLHPDKYKVRVVSCEVWQEGVLVAGELGILRGSLYLSLTGLSPFAYSSLPFLLSSLFPFVPFCFCASFFPNVSMYEFYGKSLTR